MRWEKIHDGALLSLHHGIEVKLWMRSSYAAYTHLFFSLSFCIRLVRLGSQRGFQYIMLSKLWLLNTVEMNQLFFFPPCKTQISVLSYTLCHLLLISALENVCRHALLKQRHSFLSEMFRLPWVLFNSCTLLLWEDVKDEEKTVKEYFSVLSLAKLLRFYALLR